MFHILNNIFHIVNTSVALTCLDFCNCALEESLNTFSSSYIKKQKYTRRNAYLIRSVPEQRKMCIDCIIAQGRNYE